MSAAPIEVKIEDVLGAINQPTLVKFNSPVMVGRAGGKPSSESAALANMGPCQDLSNSKIDTEAIFSRIIPPREWIVDGNIWRQTVSTTPATRGDVIALEEMLNARLQQQGAQITGICPIRRELYSQCFDELIRQVTINCMERGLLLLRVRDETKLTLSALRALYESAAAYGLRKTLRSMSNKLELEKQLDDVEVGMEAIQLNTRDLQNKYNELALKYKEQEMEEAKKHEEEAHVIRQSNEVLKRQLEESIIPLRINPTGLLD